MHHADLGCGHHAAFLACSCAPELADHAGLWVGMLEIILLQLRAARLEGCKQLWGSCVLYWLDFLLKLVCRINEDCIVPIHGFRPDLFLAARFETIEPPR